MTAGCRRTLAVAALVTSLAVLASESPAQPPVVACEARPVVDRFVRAFNAGELSELDSLFADVGAGWSWYSVSDRAGQRLEAAKNRRDLVSYSSRRHLEHETLRIVRFRDNGGGNFEFELVRRADDLAEGRHVRRPARDG